MNLLLFFADADRLDLPGKNGIKSRKRKEGETKKKSPAKED
jgi:hypothetical protein